MSATEKILGTEEAWESDKLGNDPKFARAVSLEITNQIDDAICLQSISIRLEKKLVESFKVLAEFHGVGYQPLMRDALNRFATSEMKAIVSGFVESQRSQKPQRKIQAKERIVRSEYAEPEQKCA